ncbi:MAG TPA: hypothetical protein VKV79_01455 [Terriglobia bacterium]|nr:hypothetical protein [Terriglobia bacterium]
MPEGSHITRMMKARLAMRQPVWAAAVSILLLAASAVGKSPRKSAPQPQGLPDQINQLAKQLEGVRLYDAGAIPGQIQALVLRSLTAWIAKNAASTAPSRYPLDVRVRMQLERDFSELHYPVFGHPAVFVRPWKNGEVIGAGYTLGWSDFARVNVLALFLVRAGKPRLAAVTHFVPRTDLHYAFFSPPPSGDFRFLVYGNRLGKSQPRLTAAFYSFDGKSLKKMWQRQDLYAGRLETAPQSVTLTYLIEDEYIQAVQQGQLPPRHEAIYQVTPQGLTLETERQIPFSASR